MNYFDIQENSNNKLNNRYIESLKMSNSGIFEEQHKHKNGKLFERSIIYKIIELSNKQGEVKKVVLTVLHDLKDRKEAEIMRLEKEAAEIANISKSTFLSNMSHELRTPMHGILSYANMGLKRIDKLSPEKTKKYFTNIKLSGERLMRHLNDLLDLAKLEAGRMDMDFEDYDIVDMLNICVAEQAARMIELEIGQTTSQPPLSIITELDSARIGQVITNFLSNAIKFAPKGTNIDFRITTAQLEDINGRFVIPGLLFSTRDYGKGIPKTELDLVFDKFTQSSDTITGTTKGTGLGLPICKEIVDAHHGKIWAENHPKGGAIFTFIIPLKQLKTDEYGRRESDR